MDQPFCPYADYSRKSSEFETRRLDFTFLSLFLAVWPWAGCLISVGFGFLGRVRMKLLLYPPYLYRKDYKLGNA